MITLAPVNSKTFRRIVDMKLPPEQSSFVAPNVLSLAQAWLEYDAARPYAILNNGEAIGFIMLDWDEGERTVGIWRFMIDVPFQRKGYGREALRRIIAMVRATGKFDLIHLDYVPANTAASALYRSMGFAENGEMEDGEIVMTLPLTDTPDVGVTTADDDDTEELLAIAEQIKKEGGSLPSDLTAESLEAAMEEERVLRFTLMGKAIGFSLDGKLFLPAANADRKCEITTNYLS